MSWGDVSDMDVMDVMLTWMEGGTVRKGSLSHLAVSIQQRNTCIAAGRCCWGVCRHAVGLQAYALKGAVARL